ncbi:FkbM family methyltransferase [Bremerella sp. JC817]|uniref:FkbM family methyltransferase n=1 Tax=Bremerella sp. JC817 TaxID=3231756 RepID=UPI003458A885
MRTLRQLERSDSLSLEDFRELLQVVLRLAEKDVNREAYLGIRQINAAQDAIIKNMLTTIVNHQEFLLLDIGAHDGWFLDRIANFQKNLHVIAFEPNPAMTANLQARQSVFDDLTVIPKAVGDAPGQLSLRVYPQCDGLSSLLPFEEGYHYLGEWFDDKTFHLHDVEVIRIDDFLAETPATEVFPQVALKIDVQGFEDKVLAGADKLLQSGRVKTILIELVTEAKYEGSADLLELLNQLKGYGFVVYDINPFYREHKRIFQERPIGRLTELDCLLVHTDYLAQL